MLDLMETPKRHALELRPLLKHFQDEHKEIDRAQKAELQYVVDDLEDADDTLKSGMALHTTLLKLWQQAAADKAQRPKAPEPVPRARAGPDRGHRRHRSEGDAKAATLLAKVINDTPKEKWAEGPDQARDPAQVEEHERQGDGGGDRQAAALQEATNRSLTGRPGRGRRAPPGDDNRPSSRRSWPASAARSPPASSGRRRAWRLTEDLLRLFGTDARWWTMSRKNSAARSKNSTATSAATP